MLSGDHIGEKLTVTSYRWLWVYAIKTYIYMYSITDIEHFFCKFTYPGRSVSYMENDINTRLAKAWTTIDRLLVIWRLDLSDKMICSFSSKQRPSKYCYMDAPHGRWLSAWRKSLTVIAQEYYEPYWINPGSNIPQNSSCTATYHPSRKPSKLDESDMRDTAGELRTNS